MKEGFSNKEMLIKILAKQEESIIAQTQLLSHAKNTDSHLEQLNSKVATNVTDIAALKTEHSNYRAVGSAFMLLITGIWAIVTFIFKP